MKCSSSLLLFIFLMPFVVVSCLDDDKGGRVEDLQDELDGQYFDIGRVKRFIAAEEKKLQSYQQAAQDLQRVEVLEASLVKIEEAIAAKLDRNADISDEVELAEFEFERQRNLHWASVRKAAIGKNVDLSATKGDDFKNVRLMTVSPIAITVYRPSGPQTIPFHEIPLEVRDLLLMSEEEMESYLQRKGESAAARAEKLKKWKEGQADRDREAAKEAFAKKVKELQEEIYQRENAINIRIQEIKGWKSKASNLELEVAREKDEKKALRIDRYAELVRNKAQALADFNSDAWIVVVRLRAELEDLKRSGGP